MAMTAATKNLFGTVPGLTKGAYHYRFPEETRFADMLVDLNEYFKPRLCVVDAVWAMEGNGPTQGRPRKLGALLASKCPYSVDLACAKLIGLKADDVPTLAAARRRGLIPQTAEELNVHGDLNAFVCPDFDNIRHFHAIRFYGTDSSAVWRARRWKPGPPCAATNASAAASAPRSVRRARLRRAGNFRISTARSAFAASAARRCAPKAR